VNVFLQNENHTCGADFVSLQNHLSMLWQGGNTKYYIPVSINTKCALQLKSFTYLPSHCSEEHSRFRLHTHTRAFVRVHTRSDTITDAHARWCTLIHVHGGSCMCIHVDTTFIRPLTLKPCSYIVDERSYMHIPRLCTYIHVHKTFIHVQIR